MTITSINTADAKDKFADLVNRVIHNREQIILTRCGKEVAAIIPYEDLLLLLETRNKIDLDDAMNAMQEARNQGTITLDALKEEIVG